mmetsp:Transcript_20894/g.62286  ORF Transcript_20894/g.62286 Transcript_20894/m.62286 type:complete len:273 (+) Transcript_20894:1282-2100(+)
MLHLVLEEIRGNQVHLDVVEDLQAILLGVGRPSMCKVADQSNVDGRSVPLGLLQQGEHVDILVERVRVAPIPCVQEGRRLDAIPLRVRRQHGLEPAADALQRAPNHEDAPLRGVDREHLHGVRDGLVLLERRGLGLELVDLDAVPDRRVAQRLLRPRRALHEDQVDGAVLRVELLGLVRVENLADRRRFHRLRVRVPLLHPPGPLQEVELLRQRQIRHDLDGAAGAGRLSLPAPGSHLTSRIARQRGHRPRTTAAPELRRAPSRSLDGQTPA